MRNPIAAPIADAATAIVMAAASLAGALNKKGYPMAANTYPTTQIQKF